MAWTLDPPLGLLRSQLQAAAPKVTKSGFGTIGDPAHAARTSAHNPESPPPAGNPDNEVDALDVPHEPGNGLDCGKVTEALRLSRDHRLRLVIFNRRIFSSYDHVEGPAWTWRPYREDDPHDTHAHIERNDSYRGDMTPWEIGIDMNPYIQHVMNYRLEAVIALRPVVNVTASSFGGKSYPAFSEPNVFAVTLRALANPDVDETKLAALLEPMLRDIMADVIDDNPADGLTQAEVTAAIEDALSRSHITVAPAGQG